MTIYRRLVAWQLAMDLLCDIYALAEELPRREQFVLTQQLCKAALSIPSNIAEGRGRGTRKDFRHFVMQARGSLYEVETQITAAQKLGYIGTDLEPSCYRNRIACRW